MKKRTHSQNLWLNRFKRDNYFKLSKKNGYRSRAAYKLLEINDKYKIFKKAVNVIDLGASPGGWSQVISLSLSNTKSKIFAIDQKEIEPIENVFFIKKKIEELDENIIKSLITEDIGLIVSDIAPDSTGHKFTDQARADRLCYNVIEFVKKNLKNKGNFVCKYLRGSGEKEFISEVKKIFSRVEVFKPKASRDISKEIYIVCLSFNNLQ